MNDTCFYNASDVIAEFGDALRAAGLRLKASPIMDGAWHRAPVEGDKGRKSAGRYRGYLNGRPAGRIENFRDPTRNGNWRFGTAAPRMSAADRAAAKQAMDASKAVRARDTETRLAAIAEQSAAEWEHAAPAPADHAYLVKKGIPASGLRVNCQGRLVVPMHNVAGRLRCLQTIAPDGGKLFPRGAQVHGLHLLLGEVQPGGVLLIAEGYATGATLHAATGAAVAVAFSKSNFTSTAQTYSARFPGLRIGFCGDNDHHHPRRPQPLPNGGREAAEAAARDNGGTAILPTFEPHEPGTDWNDWAATYGNDAVRAAVEAALPLPPAPLKPHYPAPRQTREEAIATTDAVILQFATDATRTVEINHEWQRKQADVDKRVPTGSPGRREALKRARAEMAAGYGADWAAPGHRVLLSSPAGAGKTTVLAAVISDRRGSLGKVIFLSNLLLNSEDVAGKISGAAVVRGRLAADPEALLGTLMCLRPDAVRAVTAAGLPINETLCAQGEARCPRFGQCGYQREQRRLSSDEFHVFCGAHEHLTTPARAMRGADVVIIDERFIEKSVDYLSFGLDRLLPTTMENYRRAGLDNAMAFRGLMQKVQQAVVDPAGILAGVRARGISNRDHLQPAIDYILCVEDDSFTAGIGPNTPDADLIERLEKYQKSELSAVRKMLVALQEEIHLPRDHPHGVSYRPDEMKDVEGTKERQNRIQVFYRKELAFPDRVPVLVLDASGDLTALRRVLGNRLEGVEARCESKVFVTKVRDRTLPRTEMTGKDKRGQKMNDTSEARAEQVQEKIAAIVNGLAAQHGDEFFFITNKAAKEAIQPRLSPDVLTGHFGGVRGSNAFEHCLAGANAGREQPPPIAMETIARALWSDDPEPLNLPGAYVKAVRAIRMRDGGAVQVEVYVHPDPRVQSILELFRERENEQDMARLRLIHNPETKHWYDLCNVPNDVTVDRLITFDQLLREVTGRTDNGRKGTGRRFYGSRLEEAIRRGNGVLPLSPSELLRLHGGDGGLWGSETSAERDLKNTHTLQIDLFTECGGFPPVKVRYRRPGQRGHATAALVSAPRNYDAILAKLSAVVGEGVRLEEIVPPDKLATDSPPAEPLAVRPPRLSTPASPPVPTAKRVVEPELAEPPVAKDLVEAAGLPLAPVKPPLDLLRLMAARAGGRPVTVAVAAFVPIPLELPPPRWPPAPFLAGLPPGERPHGFGEGGAASGGDDACWRSWPSYLNLLDPY